MMIIKHYGGQASYEKIRTMLKTDSNGTTAYHLIDVAKKLGFEAKGVRCELNDLNYNNLLLPCIAYVTIDSSYQHYIVIYKINFTKKTLIIADPADDIKKITFDEFEKIWNNILIILNTNNILSNDYSKKNLLNFIIKIYLTHKTYFVLIFILSLITTLFSIFSSFYLEFMLDMISYGKKKFLFMLFIVFLIFNLIKVLTDYFRDKILINIQEKIDFNLTFGTFKKIILLPYHYFRSRTTGDVVSRITDINVIKDFIIKASVSLFVDFILAFISFFILLFINKNLFLVSLGIIFVYALIIILFNKYYDKKLTTIQQQKSSVMSYMIESISAFESVKGNSLEEETLNKFENNYCKFLNKSFKLESVYNFQTLLKKLVNNVGSIIIIFIGCKLVIENKLTFGQLLSFNTLLSYFLEPIKSIVNMDLDIRKSKIIYTRVSNLELKKEDNALVERNIDGNIKASNLSYTYNDKKLILNKVNFDIPVGNKVMIIGKSGSGKSTLVKMLLKYYECNRNELFIDDIDINDYKETSIKDNIVYISQNEMLFTDTLYNNIIYNRNIDIEDFLKIEKMCMIEEIIKENISGFNMMLEENGFNISGGERQRIVLARSLLSKFNILIIDEGLNQMDIGLERQVLKNIFNEYKSKTIIIVSHRLENMDLFDQVLELSNGKIIKDAKKND